MLDLRRLVEIDHELRRHAHETTGKPKEDLIKAAQLISGAVYDAQTIRVVQND